MTGRARICLVDDEIEVCEALALGLSDVGYEVFTAASAAAALNIIRTNEIDALVTDLNMPGTTGAELIAEASKLWPKLPIIAVSGAGITNGRNTADVARELGADATFLKPFRASKLADGLERLFAAKADD